MMRGEAFRALVEPGSQDKDFALATIQPQRQGNYLMQSASMTLARRSNIFEIVLLNQELV